MSWDGPSLLDRFERSGEWWLPGDPAGDRRAGTASFDPSAGVRLKTFRPFREEGRLEAGSGFRPPLIQGFWGQGTPVTLYQTTRGGPARLPGSDRGSEFYARYAIDGHHFYSEEDVILASLQVGFTDLEAWARHSPFVDAIPVPGAYRSGYHEMAPVVANEVGMLGARLTIKSHMPSWALVPMRTLRWEHRVVFEIEPEEARPLRWYRSVLGGLQDFLALMVGRPVYPTTAEAQVHRGGSSRPDLFFDGGPRSSEGNTSTSHAVLSREGDVLLPLPDVRRGLPAALEAWFVGRQLLAPVHALFFGALFGSRMSPEFRFLSLAGLAPIIAFDSELQSLNQNYKRLLGEK